MAASGYTPISLYYSTTASAVPTAANLVSGELAINITDGKLYYEDNAGVVQLLASKAGASGDVVGPASATDNAIARYDGTTGKLIQNSTVTVSDGGAVVASTYESTVSTGTAPFIVASTTKVNNLNADLLDGLSSDAFDPAGTAVAMSIALG